MTKKNTTHSSWPESFVTDRDQNWSRRMCGIFLCHRSLYLRLFLRQFEEEKILNTKSQIESFFHIQRENYYRTISFFFGHDEMVTQVSTGNVTGW